MATKDKKLKIVFFHRKTREAANYSVEIYFDAIRKSLPASFDPVVVTMPFRSSGIFQRLANMIYCVFKQGDINHITGDIHYVGVFLKRKRTILTILDCGMLKRASGLRHSIFKLLWYTLPAKRANYITVISEATKQDVLNYIEFPPEKIKVIYVCISDAFQRNDASFNKTKPTLLQIGTAENKNLRRLVPALAGIPCKLVIIGKIPDDIVQLLEENHIEYENAKGLTEAQVIQYYEQTDIVSFASTLEGFGMPIVEANTIGRCVMTGNTSSMPEVAGDAAHIVNPFSVDEIREGILRLINDDAYRESLIHSGYENAKRFSKQTIVQQCVDLYNAVALENDSNPLVYEQQL